MIEKMVVRVSARDLGDPFWRIVHEAAQVEPKVKIVIKAGHLGRGPKANGYVLTIRTHMGHFAGPDMLHATAKVKKYKAKVFQLINLARQPVNPFADQGVHDPNNGTINSNCGKIINLTSMVKLKS